MKISLIVALSRNRVIGIENRLPWRLPSDLKRFKAVTLGHPVIMGRKTFESIGRLLPGRTNVILSRDPAYRVEGAKVFHSLEEALSFFEREGLAQVFVIGGAQIYAQALPRAQTLYLTWVESEIEGDAYFPEWDSNDFRETEREAGQENGWSYQFQTLERLK